MTEGWSWKSNPRSWLNSQEEILQEYIWALASNGPQSYIWPESDGPWPLGAASLVVGWEGSWNNIYEVCTFFDFRFIYVYECFDCIHMCCVCASCSWMLEEGVGSLGAEWRMAANYHVGAGNWPPVLCRSNKYSSLLTPCFLTFLLNHQVRLAQGRKCSHL